MPPTLVAESLCSTALSENIGQEQQPGAQATPGVVWAQADRNRNPHNIPTHAVPINKVTIGLA